MAGMCQDNLFISLNFHFLAVQSNLNGTAEESGVIKLGVLIQCYDNLTCIVSTIWTLVNSRLRKEGCTGNLSTVTLKLHRKEEVVLDL